MRTREVRQHTRKQVRHCNSKWHGLWVLTSYTLTPGGKQRRRKPVSAGELKRTMNMVLSSVQRSGSG